MLFGRYRDDCLSLWCGDKDRLQTCSLATGIKFTMEVGGNSICFLDLRINLSESKLSTTVYSTPTSSLMYLHGDSCHPKRLIDGISLGVATRLRRICSNDDEFAIGIQRNIKLTLQLVTTIQS